ncbi:MAG: DUF5320 domain-containing protein [Nanoarchaeota archaeon]|nr:DUF5320 domain-containing protein [Nanoarchaeota archaeon]
MPNRDGTGPGGYGSRTGGRMGFCSGFNAPGYTNSGFGRGFGFSRGRCRGFGWRFWQPVEPAYPGNSVYSQLPKDQEKQMLEQEAKAIEQEEKALKEEKESVKKRLEELK